MELLSCLHPAAQLVAQIYSEYQRVKCNKIACQSLARRANNIVQVINVQLAGRSITDALREQIGDLESFVILATYRCRCHS
jgi:hypothetical protein